MLAGVAVPLLLLSACSGTDSSSVASGPGDPVATTPPLAIPPVLRQSGAAVVPTTAPALPPATNAPEVAATAVPDVDEAATVAPATAVPEDDAETPDAAATPVPESATAVPDTAAPAATTAPTAAPAASSVPAATAAPTTAPTVAPAPTSAPAQPAGATIALGDFEVVNLTTGANQNIAQLAPSGPTMLWFWAPH